MKTTYEFLVRVGIEAMDLVKAGGDLEEAVFVKLAENDYDIVSDIGEVEEEGEEAEGEDGN